MPGVKVRKLSVVLLFGVIFSLFNPNNAPMELVRAFLVTLLLATFLLSKLCWIPLDKAFGVSFMYVILSIVVSAYTTYGLDLLIDSRPTTSRVLAAQLDERVRETTGKVNMAPSHGVVAALTRYSLESPSDDGILQTFLAPLRATKKAKETIDKVNIVATGEDCYQIRLVAQ